MLITTALAALALGLVASRPASTTPKNSRQGSEPIFTNLRQEPEPSEAGIHAGFSWSWSTISCPVSDSYNNRNRHYNPQWGRFTSKDPIGFNGGNNLWGYCWNNPVIFVDPDGLRWTTASDMLGQSPNLANLQTELEIYISQDLPAQIFAFGKRLLTKKCWPSNAPAPKDVYIELLIEPAMYDYLADASGYSKKIPPNRAPFNSHGKPVYQKGTRYITPDVDRHRGGYWKLFDNKGNRLGTYNEDMVYVGP